MKIYNKIVESIEAPENKNDIWLNKGVFYIYKQGKWVAFTVDLQTAKKLKDIAEKGNLLIPGEGIIIEDNEINLTLKTVNGESIIGEGNIIIEGGGDSPFEKGEAENSAVLKGGNNQVTNANEVALGEYNKSNNDTQFSIGIGTSDTDRGNAFEVKQNGDVYITRVEKPIQTELTELSAEVGGLSERVDELGQPIFKAIYGETKIEEIIAAYESGMFVHCDYNSYCFVLAQINNGEAFFTAVNGAYAYRIICSASSIWVQNAFNSEQTVNKVTILSSSSTDTQYPSAKAVYDALQNVGGSGGGESTKRFALLYETTIEAETDRLDLITLVPNILDNKDFVIETELTAGDGTNTRDMFVRFSSKNASFNTCWLKGLNKATYQTHYLIKIHIGNDWMYDSSCYVECHNNSWNNEQKADGLQGLNLFAYNKNLYPIDTMYINFPFKVGDKIRIYGK